MEKQLYKQIYENLEIEENVDRLQEKQQNNAAITVNFN